MATKIDKSMVDILPVFSNNDAKKVYDHSQVKFNQIILSVFNQMQMENGTLDDYPDCGCLESLLTIHFSESQKNVENEIRKNLEFYQDEPISVEFIKDENDRKSISIEITVDSVPNYKFTADIVKNKQSIRIVNPEIISRSA